MLGGVHGARWRKKVQCIVCFVTTLQALRKLRE